MSVAHLLAAASNASSSPVLAVGYAVIDHTPTAVKDWAIAHFGTKDKPLLLGTVALVVVVATALIGLLAGRRKAWGAVGLAALAAVPAWAVMTRPSARIVDLGPTLVAFVVGIGVMLLLLRLSPSPTPSEEADMTEPGRRVFVGGVLGSLALSGLAVAAGQRLLQAASTAKLSLPRAWRRATPIPAGFERRNPAITPLRTPNESFYRVDTALTVPQVERESWTLTIDGDVHRRVTFTYDDIAAMKLVEKNITMTCVSNEVGGEYVGGATWLGVPVRRLLAEAGIKEPHRADAQVLSTSTDGFTAGTPLAAMLDDRDALLAIGMNGEPLPRRHGFPARLVVPGLYGMIGSTKWVTKLTVTTFAEHQAYWTQRGWSHDAPIKPSARIDSPSSLAQVKRGVIKVGGIAWAQRSGVRGVQVRLDGGPWRDAELGPEVNEDFWRQWMYRLDASSLPTGQHTVSARVIDADGDTQTAERAPVFPDGSSGLQEQVFFLT